MLVKLAQVATRRHRLVLALALFIVLAAGAFGGSAVSKLSSGGFTDASSPSTRADAVLATRFHQGDPNLVFLVSGQGGVNSPAVRAVGTSLARSLRSQANVTGVASYWSAPGAERAAFVSNDGRYGLVTARVLGGDNIFPKRADALAARYEGTVKGVTVQAGGLGVADYQINKQISRDLAVAEAVAVPLTFLALVLVFGSLVASLLPLATGGIAILGTFAVLRVLTLFVPVSVYALNLTTALGLGLAIDYSLFIVSRYREELARGKAGPAAIEAAVAAAGRTVLFSSLTVALSLAAMLVFPFYFLRSFAYAGLAVVAIAAFSAVVVLPALLSALGRRVNMWDVRPALRRLSRRRAGRAEGAAEAAFWRRVAESVMRRPWAFGGAVLAILLVLGAPFLSVRFGLPDDRALPASASSHQVGNILRGDFRQNDTDAITVVMASTSGVARPRLAAYSAELSRVPGVRAAVTPVGTYIDGVHRSGLATPLAAAGGSAPAAYFTLEDNVNPYSSAGLDLVREVRELPAPATTLVTGLAARDLDSLNALGGLLPVALALIGVSTIAVLYAFTRSLLIPLKAIVLNILSLSATFGAMVWVFQDGHLSSLLGGVGATGYLNASMPVLMFCIAFGLSMDYEVFLLSRIKEEWDRSDHSAAANTAAVARGLERTGRIVTAAAALVSIVFISVATSQVSFIKMFGTGMALAVLMDATLVRGVLVPAFMRLAGRANWWAPRWLPRSHARDIAYEIPSA
ncbi:MAG TPA: MMPL family transporter [Acidimicrobiales bacterium]|nr:MMPL family transporter [Acidimicrobiales bacterium]